MPRHVFRLFFIASGAVLVAVFFFFFICDIKRVGAKPDVSRTIFNNAALNIKKLFYRKKKKKCTVPRFNIIYSPDARARVFRVIFSSKNVYDTIW